MKAELTTIDGLAPDVLALVAGQAVGGLPSAASRRVYTARLRDFLKRLQEHQAPLTRTAVQSYIREMRKHNRGAASINQSLSAIKKLAEELAERDLLDRTTAQSILSLKGDKIRGVRAGNWLTLENAQALLDAPASATADQLTDNRLRDRALLALLIGCGVRRAEAANLTWDKVTERWDRWVLADVIGKGKRVRTIAIPDWAAERLLEYRNSLLVTSGSIFRLTESGIWWVVKTYADRLSLIIRPHDLRRTYAALSHQGGADIRQIQSELGHASVQTTERYLGSITGLERGRAAGDHIKFANDPAHR